MSSSKEHTHVTHIKRGLAALLLLAAFAMPTSALASQTTSETLSVPNVITLSGVPASLDYGTVTDTGVAYHAAPFTLHLAATGQATLSVSGADFVGPLANLSAAYRDIAFDDGIDAPSAIHGDLNTGLFGGNVKSVTANSRDILSDATFTTDALVAGAFTSTLTWDVN